MFVALIVDMSHIWPDAKFNGKLSSVCFAWIGATAAELWKGMYCVCVFLYLWHYGLALG